MTATGARPLALATWNLLHGVRVGPPVDGRVPAGTVDLDGVARGARLLDADVLGLQEVDRAQPRSGSVDQAELVADAVGARDWRFVPALLGTPGERTAPTQVEDGRLVDGPSYGVALVSRLPVRSWHVRRFAAARARLPLYVPGPGLVRVADEDRVVLAAVLELPGGSAATVATGHLSFVPGANVRQLRAACAWLTGFPAPRLLLGDLNLPGRLPGLVTRWTQLALGPTYPSWRARVQWDHLLGHDLAGLRALSVEVRALPVSDHCALRVGIGR